MSPSTPAVTVVRDPRTHAYVSSVTSSMPAPRECTVFQLLLDGVDFDDPHVCFKETKSGRELTLGALKLQSQQLGAGLLRSGLKPGDVVMLLLPNSLSFVLVLLATQFAGVRCALANPGYQAKELKHVHDLVRPRKVFTTTTLMKNLMRSGIAWNKAVTVDSPIGRGGASFVRDLMIGEEEAKGLKPFVPASFDETTYLPFSSGTTGMPKGVEISHKNVSAMVNTLVSIPDGMGRGEKTVGFLPFFHAMALLIAVHCTIFNRGKVFIIPAFEPVAYAELVKKEQISTLGLVPPVLNVLAIHPKINKEHFKSVRYVSCGAAPLDAETQRKFSEKTGVWDVRQGWGMTETTVGCFGLSAGAEVGTVGRIMPGCYARLVDPDTGKDVPQGERGEVWVRGANITKGYYRNPEATKGTFSHDGWLKTGDVGVMNEKNELRIVDRIKELIKYKGWQVAPAELEGLLLTHPKVMAAAVIGVYSKEQATELPRAFKITPGLDASATASELIDFVKGKTSPQKHLRGGVRVLDAVPVSPSGKVLRKELRKLVEAETAAAAAGEEQPQAKL